MNPAAAAGPGAIAASVIVVSRGRPAALLRCLAALRLSDHPRFEVIVVADAQGRAAIAAAGLSGIVRVHGCEVANIAIARNIGLADAAADVVAFIDDDAVAEPTWLSRLVAPFADPGVVAAGGFVRGRNGFSLQWGARTIDRDARERPLEADPHRVSLHDAVPGRAVRTEGTNCAFRRPVLAALGGFDPAHAFYLDESDVNMRVAAAGGRTAIVPGAQVHHLVEASARRTAARVPLSLHDIGASVAVFVRRHGGDLTRALDRLRDEQRRRLLRHMVGGGLVPGDVGRLLATLEAGIAAGIARDLAPLPPVPASARALLPVPGTGPRRGVVIAGRAWQRRALRRAALAAAAGGAVATVVRLSPGARRHRARFDPAGYWEQAGGVFGLAERAGPHPLRPMSFRDRVRHEAARIAVCRPVGPAGQGRPRKARKGARTASCEKDPDGVKLTIDVNFLPFF